MNSHSFAISALFASLFLYFGSIAHSQDSHWIGSSYDFIVDGHWDTGLQPVDGHTVHINIVEGGPNTEPFSPRISTAVALPNSDFYIGENDGNDGTLTIENGGSLENRQTFVGAHPNAVGQVRVNGTGSEWNVGSIYLGSDGTAGTGQGHVMVEDGGAVNTAYVYAGWLSNQQNTLQVSGTDMYGTPSSLTALQVYVGTGSMTVDQGAAITTEYGYIGYNGTGISTALIDGAGTLWSNGSDMLVGVTNEALLTISGGAAVTSSNTFVGYLEEATTVVTGAGSQWTNTSLISLGGDGSGGPGQGHVLVEDGGAVSTFYTYIGANTDQESSLYVSGIDMYGTPSSWASTQVYLGVGSMTVDQGATMTTDQAYIGYFGTGTSTVLIDGTGTLWSNTDDMIVGVSNDVQLTISGGAMVTNSTAYLGYFSGPQVAVTVTGPDSSFANTGDLHIGYEGSGQLMIADGGTVTSALGEIGFNVGSEGFVSVDGAGSNWTLGEFDIGYEGIGTLTISNEGLVHSLGGTGTVYIGTRVGATGTLNIGAAAGNSAVAPGTLSAGELEFGAGTSTLVFNHTDETGAYTFAPDLAFYGGAPTIEHHAGFTRLTGDGSVYSETTNVYGGTLAIENMLGGTVNIMSGGTVGGSGTANGDVIFGAGANYLVEMDGATGAQGLLVEGEADLAGTVMLAGNYAGITGMGPVVILTTNQQLTSEFDAVTAGSIFLTPTLSYENDGGPADYVFVSVEQTTDFGDIAQTVNQRSVAGALGSLDPASPIFGAFALLGSEDAALDAFDQLSGEAHASLKGALVENGQQAVKAVNDRIHDAFEADNANTSVSAYGDTADPANGFWMTGYGDWMTTDATGNTAEMSNDLYGVIAGIDHRFGEYGRLGILGGYSRTNTSIDALASEADADSYTVGVYGGADNGNAALSLGALYTWHSIESSRIVTNPVTEMLAADYDARSFQLFAEAGYKATMDRVTLEPFAGVSYINLNTDSFSETGGMAALSSSSETTSTTFTTLGLRSSIELASNVSTRGMVGWRHAFGDVDPSSTFTIGGNGPFSILGAPIAQDAAVVEAGIDIAAGENVTIGASYEGQYGDGAIANGFNARLLAAF